MIIYRDILSGDELFTDAYPIKKVMNDVMFKVTAKRVNRTEKFDDALIGANASEEAPDEGGSEESCVMGVDVCLDNYLKCTSFDKKSYKTWVKDYIKSVQKKCKDEEIELDPSWQKNVTQAVMEILKEFDEYEWWQGEKTYSGEDGMAFGLKYDGTTPELFFFAAGVVEEKA